jgi:tRNA threonylcarbamoyladenosine biosynthesis protein TsaB
VSLLLAFDTSTETCSVALLERQQVLAVREVTRASGFGGHSEHVLQLVSEVLAATGHDLLACDAIAFGAGPGAFTGLRVACAVAQGLALGIGCPLLAVDCLTAVGLAAFHQAGFNSLQQQGRPAARVLVLQDARMGEVYAELLDIEAGQVTVQEGPMLVTPEHAFDASGALDLVCGSALALYPQMAKLAPWSSAVSHPDAGAIAQIGALMLEQGGACEPAAAAPIYVRDQVALTIAQRAAGQRMPA